MTGHGFSLALQQYLEWLRTQEANMGLEQRAEQHQTQEANMGLEQRAEQHQVLTVTERKLLFGFVEFCMNLDAVEDQIVGDAGTPYTSDLKERRDGH